MKKTLVLMSLALVLGSSCCTRCPGCPRAAGTSPRPTAAPAALEERLSEIEKRLEYLTSELAIQRGDLDRVREKAGIAPEGAGK